MAALLFDAPLAVSQVNIPMKNSASELADKLRKLGVKKVAVLPLAFVEDRAAEQVARTRNQVNAKSGGAIPGTVLSASMNSLRVAEEMQRYLSEAGRGDFGLVPAEDLFERLSTEKLKLRDVTPTSKDLIKIVNPAGDIEALVVNTLRNFHDEIQGGVGNVLLGPEQNAYEWSLLSCSDRTILASRSVAPKYVSLAEAVYGGLSVEYFRYQNGRLTSLLAHQQNERKDLPLLPSDPEALYNKDYIFTSRVHPLLNPNCPFKVDFLVNDRVLPVLVAETKTFAGPEILSPVVINLEPGDEPTIRVANTSAQQVMVAVFVDGVNVLGKVREIPDESCRAWVLDQKKTAKFKSWWTGDQVTPVEESGFVIEEWRQSVAGKLGLSSDADSARSITIVFFTVGTPKREDIQFFPRHWLQRASLSTDRKRMMVAEQLEPPGSVGAAPNMFGMGAKAPKPGQLNWVQGATVGTILASMQVRYCPSSETKATFQQIVTADRFWQPNNNFTIVPISTGR
ncbi:MAG: hypothetical protein ACK494_01390 [Planctomycetota bacterium]